MTKNDIARLAHEVNRAYCDAIGDHSIVRWEDAPLWQRESSVLGVEFHLAHPDSLPADSHESWLRVKVDDGWQWGSKKDATLKRHPCIMPFEQLPKEQQIKDHLFTAIVHACSANLDQ